MMHETGGRGELTWFVWILLQTQTEVTSPTIADKAFNDIKTITYFCLAK